MAEAGPYRQLMGWSIYRNATNCSAYMAFDNGEIVGFTYDAPGRSTRVAFTNADAKSLEDRDSPTIDILVRQPDGQVDRTFETTVFTVSVDQEGGRTLLSRWLGPPALKSFMEAGAVGFFDGEKELAVFDLKGSAAALQEVERCSAALRRRSAAR